MGRRRRGKLRKGGKSRLGMSWRVIKVMPSQLKHGSRVEWNILKQVDGRLGTCQRHEDEMSNFNAN